jgi:hypothetical protein
MLLPWAANAKSYSLLGFPQRSRKAFLDSHTGNVETTVFSFWGTRAGQNGRLVNMPTGSIWMDGKHWVQLCMQGAFSSAGAAEMLGGEAMLAETYRKHLVGLEIISFWAQLLRVA